MQKIYFEKLIDLNHQLSELISISVDEAISYKIETEGLKAQGSIVISGEYLKKTSKERFNESLEIDLLAPFEKVIDQRDFNIKIEDFDYRISEGDLLVTIQANVYGVIVSEDKRIPDKNLREEDSDNDDDDAIDQELIEEIKEAIKHESVAEVIVESERDVIDDLIETSSEIDLVPYYIVVASSKDTYESIAETYRIPVDFLKDYNKDKPIENGVLIVVPYYEA